MINNIKFCLLMTISKVLSAGVTIFIICNIPMMISMFYLTSHLSGETMVMPYWQYVIGWILCAILTIICAKLSLCCFRSALAIADSTKTDCTQKSTKKQAA